MVQSCLGLSPTNWYGRGSTIYPASIFTSIVLGAIFLILFLVFFRFDYGTRRKMIGLFSAEHTDEEFLAGATSTYAMPGILRIFLLFALGTYIVNQFLTAIFFYVFLAGGSENEISIACYLQWYSEGNPLYGNIFGVIFQPYIFIFTCWIAYSLRPKLAETEAQRFVQIISTLEELKPLKLGVAEDASRAQILYADSYDGMRPLKYCRALKDAMEDKNSKVPPFHMHYADKFGNGYGQIGIDEIVVRRNAIAEGVGELSTAICIEPGTAQGTDDVWHIPADFENRFDIVVFNRFILVSMGLGLASWFIEENVRLNRVRFFMADILGCLKPQGYVVVCGLTTREEGNKIKKLFREAGYKTKEIVHLVEKTKLKIPWTDIVVTEWLNDDVYSLIGERDSGLLDNDRKNKDNAAKNRASVFSASIEYQYSENDSDIITAGAVQNIFYFWIVICVVCYFLFIAMTVGFWPHFQFPSKMGMPNYFGWNLLSLIQSAPMTFVVDWWLLYDTMTNMPRPTSYKVHILGAKLVFAAYVVSLVQTLPIWIVSVLFRYFFLQEVLGIPTASFYNGLITSLVLTSILVQIIKCQKKKPVEGEGDDDKEESISTIELHDIHFDEDQTTVNPILK